MSDDYGRRPPRRPPARRRMEFEEEEEYAEEPRPRRRPPAPRSGRPKGPPAKARAREPRPSFWSRLFGGGRSRPRRVRRDEGFDWDDAQYDAYDDGGVEDGRPGRYSGEDWSGEFRSGRAAKRHRASLLELATPVFAYASILPRDAGGMHPGYDAFRQEVLTALQKIESEAQENAIDPEDAQDAVYALCLFLDGEVAASEWTGKIQWAEEPLYAVKLQDPEGGENFFKKLDAMGDRRRAAKEVFLVSLALGYRGKYADLEPTQQAARLGEIRQKVLRSIHRQPLDQADVLFPEAYEPAAPIENDVPPPPRWWLFASIGGVVAGLLIWLLLYVWAGKLPEAPAEKLKPVQVTEVRR